MDIKSLGRRVSVKEEVYKERVRIKRSSKSFKCDITWSASNMKKMKRKGETQDTEAKIEIPAKT